MLFASAVSQTHDQLVWRCGPESPSVSRIILYGMNLPNIKREGLFNECADSKLPARASPSGQRAEQLLV